MLNADTVKILVIIGTTRQGRFSEKPARWIFDLLQNQQGVESELIDLRDYPLPFFNESMSPSMLPVVKKEYENPVVKKWTKKVAEADGYIMVTGEYNHGYPAVLKNALDYVYAQWNRKAVGFVSYGSVAGGRVVEQLREVAVELQMLPIRPAVHIPWNVVMAVKESKDNAGEAFAPLKERAEVFLKDILWASRTMKYGRGAVK